jgi:transcriptional regulator with XRE-family HTH domain
MPGQSTHTEGLRGPVALGEAVRLLREERHMTPGELADAAGIEQTSVEALEAGRFDPPYHVLLALAEALGAGLAALVSFVEGLDAHAASIAFGRRLRDLRTQRGISHECLARRAGVHATVVARLERGAREPHLAMILRIARGLGVQPGELLDEPEHDKQRPTDRAARNRRRLAQLARLVYKRALARL